jgi:hypothetical protein
MTNPQTIDFSRAIQIPYNFDRDLPTYVFQEMRRIINEAGTSAPIILLVNSMGGSIHGALSVYQMIRTCPFQVDAYGYGVVAGASLLLVAGATGERRMSAECLVIPDLDDAAPETRHFIVLKDPTAADETTETDAFTVFPDPTAADETTETDAFTVSSDPHRNRYDKVLEILGTEHFIAALDACSKPTSAEWEEILERECCIEAEECLDLNVIDRIG